MRYAGEWKDTVERMGRWIDFETGYKTLQPTFMESVWWVFGQLWEKGQVYRGLRVMPYSMGCTTPLSNFEAGEDYRETRDPAGECIGTQISDHIQRLITDSQSPFLFPLSMILPHPFSLGRPRPTLFPPTWLFVSTPSSHMSRSTTLSETRISSCLRNCSVRSTRSMRVARSQIQRRSPSSRRLGRFQAKTWLDGDMSQCLITSPNK